MMKRLKKFVAFAMVASLGVLGLAGCGAGEEEAGKKVQLGYVDWAEGVAMTNLAKVVLEDKLEYEVEMTMADPGVIFTSLAEGNLDYFMDAWLPVTHKSYMDEHGENIENLGENYENARIGIVVPEYVGIDSIEELNGNIDKFGGEIVGIDSGAGIMETTNVAIEEYGLDYSLLSSSGAVMTAELKNAVESEKWIAVTGWTPHWKFAKWDLKFLEDPKNVYGESETLYTVARKGVKEDYPEATAFMENFYMEADELGELMGKLEESEDKEEAAREWMNENEDIVASWLDAQ